MTVRAAVVVGLLAASAAAAVISGRDLFYSLAYTWGGLLVVSFLWSRSALAGVRLRRWAPVLRSQVGLAFEEILSLSNSSRLPKAWLEVEDKSELPGHRVSSVTVALGGRQERTWIVRTLCTQRGEFRLGPAVLHSGDPFGLFPVTREVPEVQRLVVLPLTATIASFDLPSGQRLGGEALRQRTHQVTPNASSVRDCAPGDGLNRIHWPSTARRRRLIVKEFELDPKSDIWVFVDAARKVQAGTREPASLEAGLRRTLRPWALPASTEEYAVAAAASIAAHLLQRDRAVGLVAHGRQRHVIQADRGARQLSRLLESLAVLRAEGWMSLEQVFRIELPQMPRGANLILITPSVDPGIAGWMLDLARHGLLPMAVMLDAKAFGGPPGSRSLAAAIRRAGFDVWLLTYGQDIGPALSALLPRGLRIAA